MQFVLEVAILECSFLKHNLRILGIKQTHHWTNMIPLHLHILLDTKATILYQICPKSCAISLDIA